MEQCAAETLGAAVIDGRSKKGCSLEDEVEEDKDGGREEDNADEDSADNDDIEVG